MQMTTRETAELMGVSEQTIYRWVKDNKLPAFRINGKYRFNKPEVLEWVTSQRVNLPDRFFCESGETEAKAPSLANALKLGGIHYRVRGTDKASVLKATVDAMPLSEDVDKSFLLNVMTARENLGSTGVGDGIAIPHVRNPIVLHVPNPVISLCFLEQAIEFGSIDGKPVHTVFAIITPTAASHVTLLSRLAFAVRNEVFSEVLIRQGTCEEIIAAAARIDEMIAGRTSTVVAKGDAGA